MIVMRTSVEGPGMRILCRDWGEVLQAIERLEPSSDMGDVHLWIRKSSKLVFKPSSSKDWPDTIFVIEPGDDYTDSWFFNAKARPFAGKAKNIEAAGPPDWEPRLVSPRRRAVNNGAPANAAPQDATAQPAAPHSPASEGNRGD